VENGQAVELIMVNGTGGRNNNKIYRMTEITGDRFRAEYGRYGASMAEKIYPMYKWDKVYKSKIAKGYKDETERRSIKVVSKSSGYTPIPNAVIEKLIIQLMNYTNKSVAANYTVSAESVTQSQVDEAQRLLNILFSNAKTGREVTFFNETLTDLFQVIPRRMGRVSDHLIEETAGILRKNVAEIKKMLIQEQDNLDSMATKVGILEAEEETGETLDNKTMLDVLGISVSTINPKQEVEIKKHLGGISNKFKTAYEVTNKATLKVFNKNIADSKDKTTALLFHGSRNENFINIMKTGLLIRPSSAVYTGSMFGDGIYFADKARKSLGYTSLRGSYWSGGSDNTGFMAVFKVHTGKQMDIHKHDSSCYNLSANTLKNKGDYDSVFAHGGIDLKNNEMIVYRGNQTTIKYLIELEN